MSDEEVPAYSAATDTEYPNWDALVAAEANGHVTIAIMRNKRTGRVFAAAFGPWDERRLATNMAQRVRARFKKQSSDDYNPDTELVAVNIRPLWKELS